jgi:hypothetical protein
MSRWLCRPAHLAIAIVCTSSLAVVAQKPAVPDVLKAVGDYLLRYSENLSTVAAEEEYTQRQLDVGQASRRLHSDIVLIGHKGGSITAFRDLIAVDANPIRQRDDRLLKLFDSTMVAKAHAEASALTDEAVRHYMSSNLRMLDLPTFALDYLRPVNQDASDFSIDGVRNQNGVQVATLRFKARHTSDVVPTPTGAATDGRAWVEVGTGTIRQTELIVHAKNFSFTATTKYSLDPALGMWVPTELVQRIEISSAAGGFSNMGAGGHLGARQTFEGLARYTKFRRRMP